MSFMNPVSKKHSERGLNDLAAALATEVIGLSPHGRVRKPGRRMRVQPPCRAVGCTGAFYRSRKVMSPCVRSYGDTPTLTRSPGTTLIRNRRILPLSCASTS